MTDGEIASLPQITFVQASLVAIVAAAAAIRLYNLGGPSLEIDEATSHAIAAMP